MLLSVLLFSLEFVAAQDEYERSVFVSSSGDSLNYRLLEPEVMQAGEKYPLVLFLHGAGERGNDNEKQLTHGGQMFLNPVNRENIRLLYYSRNARKADIGHTKTVRSLLFPPRCQSEKKCHLCFRL